MFARFGRRFYNGWVFGGESLSIIRKYPKLLVFPLLISATILATLWALWKVGPYSADALILLTGGADAEGEIGAGQLVLAALPILAIYLLGWIGMIYLSAALAATVMVQHETGEMSLLDGFRQANSRLGPIVAWAVFAATIGLVLKFLSSLLERVFGRVGMWIGEAIGHSWLIVAYFVIPIIVLEGGGPITAMKRSAETIRSNFGDALGMEASMMWRLWPLHLVCFAIPFGVQWFDGWTYFMLHPYQGLALLAVFLLAALATSALLHTMGPIARARHFVFAATGEVPRGGDPAVYQGLTRS